jgi:hypothetical protein
MDWTSLATGLATAAVAIPATIWAVLRKVRSEVSTDRAERSATDWHERVIKRQDLENDRLRSEIQVLRDAVTASNKRLLEVELREKIKERIIRDLVRDIRLVKKNGMSIDALNTGLIDEL